MTEILTREEELEIIEYGIERIKANILGMFTIFLTGIIFGVSNCVIGSLLISGYLKNKIGKKKDISI